MLALETACLGQRLHRLLDEGLTTPVEAVQVLERVAGEFETLGVLGGRSYQVARG